MSTTPRSNFFAQLIELIETSNHTTLGCGKCDNAMERVDFKLTYNTRNVQVTWDWQCRNCLQKEEQELFNILFHEFYKDNAGRVAESRASSILRRIKNSRLSPERNRT